MGQNIIILGKGGAPNIEVVDAFSGASLDMGFVVTGVPYGVTASKDGKYAAAACAGSARLFVYDLDTQADVSAPSLTGVGTALAAAFSPDSRLLVIGFNNSPYIRVIDTATWGAVAGPTVTASPKVIEFSPDGGSLAISYDNSTPTSVQVFETSGWGDVTPASFSSQKNVKAICFNSSGTLLATAHNQAALKYLSVFNMPAGTAVSSFSALSGACTSVAFSPSGGELVASHANGSILTALDTTTWAKNASLNISSITNAVSGVAFTGDGRHLVCSAPALAQGLVVLDAIDWSVVQTPYKRPVASTSVAVVQTGRRFIRGSVRDITNAPASRRVRVSRRADGKVVAAAKSSAVTGDFEAMVYDGDVEYDVQFLASDGEPLNDLFFARVSSSDV